MSDLNEPTPLPVSQHLGSYSVGDLVTYKRWDGRVHSVWSNGSVDVEWLSWPAPFFNGPYSPDELIPTDKETR